MKTAVLLTFCNYGMQVWEDERILDDIENFCIELGLNINIKSLKKWCKRNKIMSTELHRVVGKIASISTVKLDWKCDSMYDGYGNGEYFAVSGACEEEK